MVTLFSCVVLDTRSGLPPAFALLAFSHLAALLCGAHFARRLRRLELRLEGRQYGYGRLVAFADCVHRTRTYIP